MNETTSRALLYGIALTVLGGVVALWAATDNEADVMVLLNSAEVQLQAAYMTPATDLDGEALTARADLLETALCHLESVERRRPGMACTAEFRGFAHMLVGEHLQAAACYERARRCADCLEEQRDVLVFNQARMLVAAGEAHRALRLLAKHRDALDARYGPRRRLEEADILIGLGREQQALQRLQLVTAEAPVAPMASLEAGLRYLQLGREAEATRALEAASQGAPIADYHLARLKLREGDVDTTFELLRRAYAARPAEVRQRLRDEAEAWSDVSQDARYQEFTASSPASPGR